MCDLERHRIVKLLPDRETSTVAAFLAGHQMIKFLSRDRGGGYGEAGTLALPHAIRVADRWHHGERQRSPARCGAQVDAFYLNCDWRNHR